MITIIFALPRTGKTCYMTHLLNTTAFNMARNRQMAMEIASKNQGGFNLTIPKHCVSTNYDITFKKFGMVKKEDPKGLQESKVQCNMQHFLWIGINLFIQLSKLVYNKLNEKSRLFQIKIKGEKNEYSPNLMNIVCYKLFCRKFFSYF